MAELSRFFNSIPGDERTYQANDFAQFFKNFLGNGFFEGLGVKTDTNMVVRLKPGSAMIEGHEYTNTSDKLLTHAHPDATNDRIDRIVLRLDRNTDKRYIKAFVKQGEASTSPKPPALTRNDYVYELSLAQVRIIAGKSYIDESQITDERGDHRVCGRVQLSRKVGDQINTVDVKDVDAKPGDYAEGISQFYLSGNKFPDIMQGWLDSIGVSPSDYGRPISSLRAYVHTVGNRTNTGVQTFTLFAWDWSHDYEIYGEWKRANNAIASYIEWGKWQENVLVVDEGKNKNGHYIRYSNGFQECWGNPFSLNADKATGSMYTSAESEFWKYPKPFQGDSTIVVSGDVSAFNRWVTTTGSPKGDGVYVRMMSSVKSSTAYQVYLKAMGRWR